MTKDGYPVRAYADLPGVSFAYMRRMLLSQVKLHGLTIREDRPERLTVETSHGLIGLRPGQNTAVAGMVHTQFFR